MLLVNIIAAVSLSIIINIKYMYMCFESLYNLKVPSLLLCWSLLKSGRHDYEWLKSSANFLTNVH